MGLLVDHVCHFDSVGFSTGIYGSPPAGASGAGQGAGNRRARITALLDLLDRHALDDADRPAASVVLSLIVVTVGARILVGLIAARRVLTGRGFDQGSLDDVLLQFAVVLPQDGNPVSL
jgi:hypothetical protein